MSLIQGFTAAYRDAATGCYPLGHGYRSYCPGGVMRFTARDDLSPFGAGGANAYAYGAGNPVNGIDPTGHDFWSDLFLTANTVLKFLDPTVLTVTTAMGMPTPPTWDDQQWSMPSPKEQLVARITLDIDVAVIGVAIAVVTLGAGLAIISGALAVIGGGLSIASDVEGYKGNTNTSKALNYASMGVGVIDGLVTGLGEAGLSIAKMGSWDVVEGAKLVRPLSSVIATGIRAGIGQTVGLGINAALYFGLPPLLRALIGSPSGETPPSTGRLATTGSTPMTFDIYPTGFNYPVAASAAITPAYPEQEPALLVFAAAQPALRPGYPAQYAALWQ
jgi:RHS repeat-associated protein